MEAMRKRARFILLTFHFKLQTSNIKLQTFFYKTKKYTKEMTATMKR